MASRLAIFDMNTGATDTVLIDPGIIEAPNWTREDTLIVNKGGLLFRIPLEKPELERIDTGFATRLNNDHGLSPDGTMLAISDASEEGASCIYTLPVGGGLPVRVTKNVPSYWHGWSPDGARLAYAAKRHGVFDIHTIPVAGGEEVRLTDGFQHTDGPDYSPDGEFIWFNGQRNGSMDLWRVEADGGEPTRMTDGPSVDWFPHPAPDESGVLYLAYPPGTEGHPRDLAVSLRFLSGDGDRELYRLTGGQGTINTPCWHPDGGRFAFVETVEG